MDSREKDSCGKCDKFKRFLDKKTGVGHCFSLKNSDNYTHKDDWCEDFVEKNSTKLAQTEDCYGKNNTI